MSKIRRTLIMLHGDEKWLPVLESMHCVFYAPLNKLGDLTDHIN